MRQRFLLPGRAFGQNFLHFLLASYVIHMVNGQKSFLLLSCRILNIYKKTYGEKDGRVGMAMCSLANAKCTKGGLYQIDSPFSLVSKEDGLCDSGFLNRRCR